MTIYGYARVSTKTQSIARQAANIKGAFPDVFKIYEESYTGTTIERPEFGKLLKRVRTGDVIVFDSVSRMSRTAEEGFALYEELFNKGIELVFIKEPYINTSMYKKALNVSLPDVGNQCLKPMMEGIRQTLILLAKEQFTTAFEQAEKEVRDIRQRTKEGMKAKGAGEKIAKAHTGQTYKVKKREESLELIRKHSKDFGGDLSDSEMIRLCGIGRNAFYRYKKMLKESDD